MFLKVKLLTNEQKELYENTKRSYICKSLKINMLKIKNIIKLQIIVIIQVTKVLLQITYVI